MTDHVEAGTVQKTVSPERLTPVCAIGASAGGVKALQEFFEQIDPGLGFAYVVIVHLAPDFPSQLSEILERRTRMPVRQVEDTPRLEPDCVYVIAPDRELVIDGNDVHSRPFTEPRGRRAPIDMFFRSIAQARCDGMAIVLTGAGSDGSQGVRKVKEAGGVVFVQDPREAEYPMMPRSAIATGVADFIAPISTLVERVREVARSKQVVEALHEDDAADQLGQILGFLRTRTGHDFSNYKRATVTRRVLRRLQVTRLDSLTAYAAYLRENPEEAQMLFDDLLISVTTFFRDPAAFEALAEEAIGPIFDALAEREEIRIWSAGSATGEEAYSLAILMLEEAERRRVSPTIQIFATDLDDGALATAREGRYPRAIEADVAEDRLKRFFIPEGEHYRIRKEVRDLVLFANHSVLKDPPFMRMDLVSCRNLLIYLDRETQRQLLALYHYALRPGGYLFLGSAETADLRPELFAPCDREARIYMAKQRPGRAADLLTELPRQHRIHLPETRRQPRETRGESPHSAHAAALEAQAPPSALVDEELRILNLSRNAGRFILMSEGPLKAELPEIVRPELRAELASALHRALNAQEATLTLPVPVAFNGSRRRVAMHVAPVAEDGGAANKALVLFIETGGAPPEEGEQPDTAALPPQEIRRLREELQGTQDRLSATRREYEGAIQELRIANEELQSMNEEYRSTAEELETSKEELQSLNEELQTVNSELKSKLEAVATAHNDLRNIVNATEIGTLFLDPELRIRMLTPSVEQLFSVTDSDVGRPISDFTHKLAYDGIEEDARRVLRDLAPVESEVETRDGRWLMMRLRPYRTVEDRIDGVVVTFVDITRRRQTEARLRESEERYRSLFETMEEGFVLTRIERDAAGEPVDLCFLDANPAATRMFGRDLAGRRLREIEPGFEPDWWELPARVARTGRSERAEFKATPLERWFELGISRLDEDHATILLKDVTLRRQHEAERELLVGELNHRVKNMLAVVQAIAQQTRQTSPDPDAFVAAFEQRVQALARAHGLLTQSHWRGSSLEALVREALSGFLPADDGRIRVEGPPLTLSANATISFAMALHELGTNALKHGALSVPEGTVEIRWRIEEGCGGATFHLDWIERGGPPARKPERPGFGVRLLERGVARELDGRVAIDYGDAGLVCRMSFPVERMAKGA